MARNMDSTGYTFGVALPQRGRRRPLLGRALLGAALCVWMLWLPQAALAWSLNVPPGTPTVNTPIGMWYLHPDIHFNNVPNDGGGGLGSALSFTVPAGNAGTPLRNQLGQFGFASVEGAALTSEGSIVMDDGVNYVIQSTQHLRQRGLGFVLQFRTRIISTTRHAIGIQTNSWTPVTSIASDQCPADWVSLEYSGNLGQSFTVRVDMDIRIHWIRLAGLNTSGEPINVTSSLSNTRIFNVRLRSGNGGCNDITVPGPVGNQVIYQFWQAMHVYRAPMQTCTTPPSSQNMTVPLGVYHAGDFPGVGNSTEARQFTFTINCPEGYNSIRYWVGSPYRVADDPDGVVRLNPGSSASGFAVKVWDGPGSSAQPIKFGAENTYAVPDYVDYKGLWLDPGKPTGDDRDQANAQYLWERGAPDYPIPPSQNYGQPRQDYPIMLKAALYQTEETITPGPFKTHILIYLVYK